MRTIKHLALGLGMILALAITVCFAGPTIAAPSWDKVAGLAAVAVPDTPQQADLVSVNDSAQHALNLAPNVARHLFGGGDSAPGLRTGVDGDDSEEETHACIEPQGHGNPSGREPDTPNRHGKA